jgi:hypothetical protein
MVNKETNLTSEGIISKKKPHSEDTNGPIAK